MNAEVEWADGAWVHISADGTMTEGRFEGGPIESPLAYGPPKLVFRAGAESWDSPHGFFHYGCSRCGREIKGRSQRDWRLKVRGLWHDLSRHFLRHSEAA